MGTSNSVSLTNAVEEVTDWSAVLIADTGTNQELTSLAERTCPTAQVGTGIQLSSRSGVILRIAAAPEPRAAVRHRWASRGPAGRPVGRPARALAENPRRGRADRGRDLRTSARSR